MQVDERIENVANYADCRRECGGAPHPERSNVELRKLTADYDSTNKINATTHVAQAGEKGEVLTGLLYVAPDAEDLHAHLNTFPTAFNTLGAKELCPGSGMLEKINAALR